MLFMMPFCGMASNIFEIPNDVPLIMGKSPADSDKFTFAIIADKAGGGENNWPIFDRAVAEINLLNPDFVMTIGDHIQGYVSDPEVVKGMWKEYFDHLSKLEAPVFLVPGNHDISNTVMYNYWKENIGKTYYSFNYKGYHFLIINSEESQSPNGEKAVAEQLDFIRNDIENSKNAKRIFIFIHKPIWLEKGLWESIESALMDTNYRVFAGHTHQINFENRNERPYLILATTGAGMQESSVEELGSFHHLTMVSVDGVISRVAIIKPGNIFPETISTAEFTKKVIALGIFDAKTNIPIDFEKEMINGNLTFKFSNKLPKPVRIEIESPKANRARWRVVPETASVSLEVGEEAQLNFDLICRSDEILPVPTYNYKLYYGGELMWGSSSQIELTDKSKMPAISEWMVAGPFSLGIDSAPPSSVAIETAAPKFIEKLAPEENWQLNTIYEINGKTASWKLHKADNAGAVQLDDAFGSLNYVIGYAQTFVYSSVDSTILIAVKGDDLARIFVNGEAATDYRLSASGELDFRLLHLNKGWNRLMIKCANYSGDWSFIMKFNDAKNQLKFSTEDKTDVD
jgi:predicted phosphodiesterase